MIKGCRHSRLYCSLNSKIKIIVCKRKMTLEAGVAFRELWCECENVGIVFCKSIVVSFVPCLIAFLGFHPYMLFHF